MMSVTPAAANSVPRRRRADEGAEFHVADRRHAVTDVDQSRLRDRRNGDDGFCDVSRESACVEIPDFETDGIPGIEERVDALGCNHVGVGAAVQREYRLAARKTCRGRGAVRKRPRQPHLAALVTPAEAETFVAAFTEELLVGLQRTHGAEAIDRVAVCVLWPVGLGDLDDEGLRRRVIRDIEIRGQLVVPQVPVIQRVEHELFLPVVAA